MKSCVYIRVVSLFFFPENINAGSKIYACESVYIRFDDGFFFRLNLVEDCVVSC